MRDHQTQKEYIILERLTSTLSRNTNQQKCRNIGGKLPEPKNEHENLFLDGLDAYRFVLGIKRYGGQWVFDIDGSYYVRWFSWASWTDYEPWPREGHGDCVSMICEVNNIYSGHRPQDWVNSPCEHSSHYDQQGKSLVCQKITGELSLLNFFYCRLKLTAYFND